MKQTAILCVDDENIVLKSLKRELHEGLGEAYVIELAQTGTEALDLLNELLEDEYAVAVVLCDYIMPDMKGDELLQRIHTLAPRTLNVMLTGQADIAAVTNAVNYANLYRYIAKPWETTDLILTVKEAINTYDQTQQLAEQHDKLQRLYAQAQQEIAERKRIEAALRNSEARIRAIVETAADGIISFDRQGRIDSFNPAAEQLFGYPAADMIGRSLFRLIPALPALLNEAAQRQCQPQERAAIVCIGREVTGKRRNGEAFPLDLTASQVHLSDVQRFTGIVRDITGRKRAEQERVQLSAIQRELTIARDIQQSLLPAPTPEWAELDVLCYNAPALDVGGDFYSYHAFQAAAPRKFALTIGDVSGKGVSAALLMATILSQFDAALAFELTPAERLAYLDKAILPYTNPRCKNCALCYLELEMQPDASGSQPAWTMHAVNAGGIPPHIKRADGEVEWLDSGGLPLGLGLGAAMGYQEVQVTLFPGDLIILTSDGVAEANASTDDMYGFERLEAAVAAAPNSSARAALEHLNDDLAAFVDEAKPYDDVTIVVIRL